MKSKAENQGPHIAHQDRVIKAAELLIHSWTLYGIQSESRIAPRFMPTQNLQRVAEIVCREVENGTRDMHNIFPMFGDETTARSAFVDCCNTIAPEPPYCSGLVKNITEYYKSLRAWELALQLRNAAADSDERASIISELNALDHDIACKEYSLVVRGVNSYPTETPLEDVILGNGWIRNGDIATFISTAGAGKSVAMAQAAMAWGLGLAYLGIKPPRPLRIILFSGEDDGVTIGQCREGFLEHSKAITGRQLTSDDLAPLDKFLRTDFSREYCGLAFHSHLEGMLKEEAADLVIINPLFSYIGGDVVPLISDWARANLMPILGRHKCAALIAHHTTRMSKESWDNIDDTYSALGGSEIANIPRSVLTLRPTSSPELSVVTVSKRKTTGWKDSDDKYTDRIFVARTGNPERPAWIPVLHDEAEEIISKAKPPGKDNSRKATPDNVVEIVRARPVNRQDLIARVEAVCGCKESTADRAIKEAETQGLIESYDEANPNGGKPIKWLRMPMDKQLVK